MEEANFVYLHRTTLTEGILCGVNHIFIGTHALPYNLQRSSLISRSKAPTAHKVTTISTHLATTAQKEDLSRSGRCSDAAVVFFQSYTTGGPFVFNNQRHLRALLIKLTVPCQFMVLYRAIPRGVIWPYQDHLGLYPTDFSEGDIRADSWNQAPGTRTMLGS